MNTLRLRQFRLPSEEAGERMMQASVEQWANRPVPKLGNRSPWELVRELDGRQRLDAWLRQEGSPLPVDEMARLYQQVLAAELHPGRRMVEAFQASGGVLNVFLDRPTPADDDLWQELTAGGAEPTPALCDKWNHAPSVLFAGLSPAQVLAGGGPEEGRLMDALFKAVDEELVIPRDGWPSVGGAVRAFLDLLRRWQCTPLRDFGGLMPTEVVLAERKALVARKLALASG